MRQRRRQAAWLGVLLLGILSGSVVDAQNATPAPLPVVPHPAECQVVPRPQSFYAPYLGTPVATPHPSVGEDYFLLVLEAQPADAATIAAVTATLRDLVACTNAGDRARILALFSERSLHAALASSGITEPALQTLATPIPLDRHAWASLVSVKNVRILPDGRVSAFVELDETPATPVQPENTLFFVFREENGQYRIDVVLSIDEFLGIP